MTHKKELNQKMKYLLSLLFVGLSILCNAQITQVIRGTVVDQESQFPLIGVNVTVTTSDGNLLGNTTDIDGEFVIPDVPLGRNAVTFSYLGYKRNRPIHHHCILLYD